MNTNRFLTLLIVALFSCNAFATNTAFLTDYKNDQFYSEDGGVTGYLLGESAKKTDCIAYLTDYKGDKYYSEDLGVTGIPYDAEPNSIEEHSFLSNIVVSPNPANATTTLTMELAQAGNLNIVVVDINGNNIMELHNANTSIGTFSKTFSLAGFANGAYFIKITHGNSIKMEKVIKE